MTPVACTFCGKFDHLEGACLLRSDPGVPTGDNPRWTVDDEAPTDRPTLVLDVHSNDPLFFQWDHRSEITESEWADLVRVVRDAARVPALEATARRWEQALAQLSDRHTATLAALLDLLTEAPDA